jgi:hypothetical protein
VNPSVTVIMIPVSAAGIKLQIVRHMSNSNLPLNQSMTLIHDNAFWHALGQCNFVPCILELAPSELMGDDFNYFIARRVKAMSFILRNVGC